MKKTNKLLACLSRVLAGMLPLSVAPSVIVAWALCLDHPLAVLYAIPVTWTFAVLLIEYNSIEEYFINFVHDLYTKIKEDEGE